MAIPRCVGYSRSAKGRSTGCSGIWAALEFESTASGTEIAGRQIEKSRVFSWSSVFVDNLFFAYFS
jgi:hypothetical protein